VKQIFVETRSLSLSSKHPPRYNSVKKAKQKDYDQGAYGGNAAAQEGDGRNLQYYYGQSESSSKEPAFVETVTCAKCEELKCFEDDWEYDVDETPDQYTAYEYAGEEAAANQQQQQQEEVVYDDVDPDDLATWITNIAGCMQTEYVQDDQSLYAGFMCNAQGNGIEIGLFLDKYCSIYTSVLSFHQVIFGDTNNDAEGEEAAQGGGNGNNGNNGNVDTEAISFLHSAQAVVTYPFTHDIDCSDYMIYATPWGSYQSSSYYSSSLERASQWCRYLFQGTSVKLDDCDGDGAHDKSNYYVSEAAEDTYELYDFYSFMLSQEELQNQVTVCQVIKSMNGKYVPVFDESGGTNFEYTKVNTYTSSRFPFVSGDFQGVKIFGLCALMLIFLVAFLGFLKDYFCLKAPVLTKEKLVIENGNVYHRRELQ
jgi:hypothetical protein